MTADEFQKQLDVAFPNGARVTLVLEPGSDDNPVFVTERLLCDEVSGGTPIVYCYPTDVDKLLEWHFDEWHIADSSLTFTTRDGDRVVAVAIQNETAAA